MPEVEIKIKVNMCSRCNHLWERRHGGGLAMTCPNCNSPYWNSPRVRGKKKDNKSTKPLLFHGEKVLDSNIDEVFEKA
jgi:uncharacterized CHY-type Zn-finger protein